MKLRNRFVLVVGLAASASLFYSAVGFADSDKAVDKENSLVGMTGSYGTTVTKILRADKPIFSHQFHIIDSGLGCDSCHPDTFEKKRGAARATGNFTMKALEEGKYCGACHDSDTAFEVTGEESCITCHGNNMQPPENIIWDETIQAMFSHSVHVEDVGLECFDCHGGTFSMKKGAAIASHDFSMTSFKEGKFCGTCHNGDDAFDLSSKCESCHFPPKEKIIFTQPVKTVVFDHDIHVKKAELSCESCHKEVFSMRKGTVEGQELLFSDDPAEKRKYLEKLHNKYCGTCHDSSQAFGYLTRCTVCHIGVKGLNNLTGKETKKLEHGKTKH